VDYIVVQSVTELESTKLRSAGKCALELDEEVEKKEEGEERKKEFEPFLGAIQKRLETWVKDVRLSGRLTKSPAVLVVAEHDYSPQLERLLSMGRDGARQRRILELNAGHALVQGLRRRFDANPNDPVVGDYAELLLGWSLLAEGSEPHDPVRFTQLVAGLMETGLGAEPAAAANAAAPESPGAPEAADSQASSEASEDSDSPAAAEASSEAAASAVDATDEEAAASGDS
jgi:molecular chaperone HtpG